MRSLLLACLFGLPACGAVVVPEQAIVNPSSTGTANAAPVSPAVDSAPQKKPSATASAANAAPPRAAPVSKPGRAEVASASTAAPELASASHDSAFTNGVQVNSIIVPDGPRTHE